MAHLPGLLDGLHQEQAALFLLLHLHLQQAGFKNQPLTQGGLLFQTLQGLQQHIVDGKDADQQTNPAEEEKTAVHAALQIGIGKDQRQNGHKRRYQPDDPPQPGRVGPVDQIGHLPEKPQQQRQGDTVEQDADKAAAPPLDGDAKHLHSKHRHDPPDNQQIVHNQQIGEQHFEGAQAQETAVDQKPHHRKRQLQIAEIQPVGQAVGGNRHFAQHIDRHQRQSQPAGTPLEVPKQDKRNDVAGQGGTEDIK